jgi:catecholate siderophore receptor
MLLPKLLIRIFNVFGVVLVAGAMFCKAQTAGGKSQLQGKVFDQNRSAVAGAKVSAINKSGSAEVSAVTDQNGEFSLELKLGEYIVKVIAKGFSETSQTINLKQNNPEALEIVLQVAGTSAVVTVGDTASYKVDAVTSATKTLTPLRDVPQAIAVVTKEQIKDQMLLSVGDAVRYMPGITAHQGENNRDQVIIRGQNTSADFFLNGVRDDVQYYRDFYNLERLETLKGPNAMIFGRGGGGGVINRVTKEAGFAPLREITVQGGSFYNRRIAGDFDQPFGERFAFRLNDVYEKSDSFRKFVNLERYGISPTFTFAPSEKTKITFGYEFFRDKRTVDRGITSFQGRPADVPISTFYGDPNNSRVRAGINILTGAIEHQFGKLIIRNRTQYGDYDRFYQNYVPGAVNAAGTLVTISAYNNATRRKNLFNQTDLTYIVSTGRIRHTFLGGVELGNQRTTNFRQTGFFNNTTTSVQAAFDNPTIYTPVTFRQSATDASNRLRLNLAATYIQDQIEINRYVQVIAGLRYDYFDLQYHNNRNNDTLRRIDNLVSPRLGIVIKPVEKLSIYGNYSISYLPSAGDQFASLTTITQQVKPEKFQNYEVGVKWDISRNLFFTSALYRLNRTNTRAIDPNNPTAIIQTGSQRTNGFEVGLNGNIMPKWSVSGGYAYQNAFINSATTAAVTGKQVAQVPHNTFSIWNKYQFTSRLGAGLGIISRSDMFAAVDNTVILPGYTRADAAVFYSFNEAMAASGKRRKSVQ